MDIARLVKNGVNLAVRVADSGTVSVTLHLKNNISFNFNAGLPEEAAETVKVVKAFDLESDKKSTYGDGGGRQTLHKTLLFKTEEIGSLTLYEYLMILDKQWEIGQVLDFDTNTTTVDIYREAISV